MKKCLVYGFLIAACAALLMGCESKPEAAEGDTFICYANGDATGLEKIKYPVTEELSTDSIGTLLEDMAKEPGDEDYHSLFVKGVEIEEWNLQDLKMDLHFNEAYSDLNVTEELLLRSGIIETFSQLEEVYYVRFFVGDEPIKDKNGFSIGYQSIDHFVESASSSLHSYQEGEYTIWYTNEDGDKLIPSHLQIRYNSNLSVEKMIVEQIVKGPYIENHFATVNPETKILGVSVRDHICYVNLDESFQAGTLHVNPEITIYSLVNSILENSKAEEVQLLVNGETDVIFKETVDLSKPFAMDQSYEKTEEK